MNHKYTCSYYCDLSVLSPGSSATRSPSPATLSLPHSPLLAPALFPLYILPPRPLFHLGA